MGMECRYDEVSFSINFEEYFLLSFLLIHSISFSHCINLFVKIEFLTNRYQSLASKAITAIKKT